MSNKAIHLLEDLESDLTGSEFKVLFHLCCAHNSHKPDSEACFPSQARLIEKTGLSNGGLNKALSGLEGKRLIARNRTRKQDGTKGPTYYTLWFTIQNTYQTPQSGDGANSTFDSEPTPLLAPNQLHPSGDKPVNEPVIEPVNAQARVSFSDFWEKWPNKVAKVNAEKAWKKLTPEQKLEAFEKCEDWFSFWKKQNATASPLHPASFLNARRWEDEPFASEPSDNPVKLIHGVSEITIRGIRDGQSWLCRDVSASTAYALVQDGYVTFEECRAAGIYL